MSPLQEQQFKEMQRRLNDIERVTNTSFVAELIRRLGDSNVTLSAGSLTGLTISVRDVTDTGSETVAAEYTGAIVLTDQQGNQYTIGTY